MTLRNPQNHHVILNRRAIQMIERHVLRNGQGSRILQLRSLVENNMPQMRWQRRRFLGVLVQIGHTVAKIFRVRSGCGTLRTRGDTVLRSGGTSFGLLLKILITGVGFEVTHIDEIIDPSLDIGHGGLIGCETPFVIDDEFERVLAFFEIVYVGEVIPRAVHGDLTAPAIKGSGYVDLSAPVFPSEYRGDTLVTLVDQINHVDPCLSVSRWLDRVHGRTTLITVTRNTHIAIIPRCGTGDIGWTALRGHLPLLTGLP
mmetsp:Transcript_31646/g.31874  ORF Transcript_31646/g.31874 Transcript_31646/m.31874 type:complete len:257 (-) Transcript_31646:304-1074(-)